METLHAPWRIEYIFARKPELKEGLFTRIAQSLVILQATNVAGGKKPPRNKPCASNVANH